MTYIGFDHHKKWTQAADVDDQGNIIREMRVLNDSSSLKEFLKGLPKPLKEDYRVRRITELCGVCSFALGPIVTGYTGETNYWSLRLITDTLRYLYLHALAR